MALRVVTLAELKELCKKNKDVRCCMTLPGGTHVTGTYRIRGGNPHIVTCSGSAHRITPRMEVKLAPSTMAKIS
jgi:hypothetical protein